MPQRVAISTLNASTIDILNVIRENASQEYQDQVPKVAKATDIPRVGEVLYGYPALANQFISALVNRIAAVRVKSATFNNPYANLKKGFLQYGETVEEVFVQIAKARVFDYEKAEARELKRSMPDVRSAFHCMNWNVQYPVTVTETDLQKAFLSMEGVQDLIGRIVDTVYKANEYDEFLLFKYLLIKGYNAGKIAAVKIDPTDIKDAAVNFRATSNALTFMGNRYNAAKVQTTTPKDDQVIFMDAKFNAAYDVNVLAAAFNMDKADFMGRLYLIDDFTTFDNERFDDIRAESDMIDEVTTDELNAMKNVKAFIMDKDWFQVYDNVAKFTEKFVAAGDYWNYFFRVQKTISYSPFANAAAFQTNAFTPAETLTGKVVEVEKQGKITVLTVDIQNPSQNVNFVQTEDATKAGVAIHKYGAILMPGDASITLVLVAQDGTKYTAATPVTQDSAVGTTITFNKG